MNINVFPLIKRSQYLKSLTQAVGKCWLLVTGSLDDMKKMKVHWAVHTQYNINSVSFNDLALLTLICGSVSQVKGNI